MPIPDHYGVKTISSYVIDSGSTTGTVAFLLVKEIARMVWLPTIGTAKDMLFQYPSLPIIQDDACLGFVAMTRSTSAHVHTGWLETVWG